MRPKIALIAEGDAETTDCWSGSARSFVLALRKLGVCILTINAEPLGLGKALLASRTFSPNRNRWRWRYRLGEEAFRARTRRAVSLLQPMSSDVDAFVQIGAQFLLPESILEGRPYIIYSDSNALFAKRGIPYSAVSNLTSDLLQELEARERTVYRSVSRIWAMSRALADSFAADFGVPPDSILVIYAGANLDLLEGTPSRASPSKSESPGRSILFVGRDYRRKGLDDLLAAFEVVRSALPDATLQIVGSDVDFSRPGVTAHGFVSPSEPEGRQRLLELYQDAAVFCLPTRYEPFGIAFVEAMLAEVPCIGPRSWAVPEIIEHGKTGWLVPDGDVRALADAIVGALQSPELSKEMGRRGRARALSMFTWEIAARHAVSDLETLLK